MYRILLTLSREISHTGQDCGCEPAGDKISLCSILTWSSKSGGDLKILVHKGQP